MTREASTAEWLTSIDRCYVIECFQAAGRLLSDWCAVAPLHAGGFPNRLSHVRVRGSFSYQHARVTVCAANAVNEQHVLVVCFPLAGAVKPPVSGDECGQPLLQLLSGYPSQLLCTPTLLLLKFLINVPRRAVFHSNFMLLRICGAELISNGKTTSHSAKWPPSASSA